jgi:stearoyl-CoA desaturase (delta-9 desaturase)
MPTTRSAAGSARRRPIVWRNAAFLILSPVLAAVAVPAFALTIGVTWMEVAACLGLWVVIGLSVTAGYHRLFSHRAYSASAPVRALFAVFGAAALQNSVIAWAAAHRFHHRNVDTDDDPYNPQEGFFYSHMGWVMVEGARHDDTSNVPDLWKDPICRWQHEHYLPIAIAVNAAIVVALGALTGRWLGMIVFALLLRVVLTHHFTFLINSAAHMWGRRPWSTEHSARDNWLLSLFTFGEGYHNYHHTFQADYRNGALWYNWDPSKWLIWTLARVGLAGDLKRSPVDLRLRRLFEQTRRGFEERLKAMGETVDAWRDRAASAGDAARAAFARQLDEAGSRCDETLTELAALRTRLQAAARQAGPPRAEVRELRRRLAEASRSARHALRTFQRLVESVARMPLPAS